MVLVEGPDLGSGNGRLFKKGYRLERERPVESRKGDWVRGLFYLLSFIGSGGGVGTIDETFKRLTLGRIQKEVPPF